MMQTLNPGFKPDANVFWDESEGTIELYFDTIKSGKIPRQFVLIINLSDVTDSDSMDGVDLYLSNQIAGSATELKKYSVNTAQDG